MEVVKNEVIEEQTEVQSLNQSPLDEFQQAAYEQAQKELEEIKKEVSNQKYLIDITKNEIEQLSNFISNDAPWKFTECLGIEEIEKELETAKKNGKLFPKALAVEAIYYFLSKVEGKGNKPECTAFDNIAVYKKILKAITGGVERIKADNERVNHAEFVLAARMEGIAPDESLTAEK